MDTIKTDCFAYKKDECAILTERVCEKCECSFYKTKKQFHDKIPNLPYKKEKKKRPEKAPDRYHISHY